MALGDFQLAGAGAAIFQYLDWICRLESRGAGGAASSYRMHRSRAVANLPIRALEEFNSERRATRIDSAAWGVVCGAGRKCDAVCAAPAEFISHAVQGWIALVVFSLAMIALPVVVAIRLEGRISIWTLLAFTAGYTLIFTGLFLWDANNLDRPLRTFPPAVSIPARCRRDVGRAVGINSESGRAASSTSAIGTAVARLAMGALSRSRMDDRRGACGNRTVVVRAGEA